jgi:chitin-binding protein
VTVSLVVTSATGTDTTSVTLVHRPQVASPWFDLGLLTNAARTLNAGDRVSIRAVSNTGQDTFLPTAPLVLPASSATASGWPLALAQAVNALNGNVRIGVLDAQNQVTPVADATANRLFAVASAGVTGAFLQLSQGPPTCRVDYQIVTSWNNGFQANLTITNTSPSIPVVGYTLNWTVAGAESFNNGWNATFLPSGATLAASNTAGAWNGVLAPGGGTSTFGFVGNKGAAPPIVPSDFRLNGQPCTIGTQTAAALRSRSTTVLAQLALPPPAIQGCPEHPSPAHRIEAADPVWAIAPRPERSRAR